MTNVNREKREMTNNPFGPLCDQDYETVDHILRRCSEGWMVRQYFSGQSYVRKGTQLSFQECVNANVLSRDLEDE